METTLGIDLGTNSIGLSLVNHQQHEIIYTNTRIFPEGVTSKTIGQGDKEESRNTIRRIKRQTKRQYFRKRLRKIKLLETLILYDMCPLKLEELIKWKNWDKWQKSAGRNFPETSEFKLWLKRNPYELRTRAIHENISLHELGRIFYHMIQRRGFLSNRKEKEDGKIFTGKDNMIGIDETRENIQNQTLGSYLYEISPKEGEKYSSQSTRVRGRYTLRDMYIHEFNTIWERQAPQLNLDSKTVTQKRQIFITGTPDSTRNRNMIARLQQKYGVNHVDIKENKITISSSTPLKNFLGGNIEQDETGLRFKSNESVLFWQRPLRSQKSLLSKCSFEGRPFYDRVHDKWIMVGPTPVPLSHPEYEEFRAYQFINNITYGAREHLSDTQRQSVFNLMCIESKEFNFSKISKHLKLFEKFNYNDEDKVPICSTIKHLKNLFLEEIWEKQYQDIWHCFYFYDNDRMLYEKLKENYLLKTNDINKIKRIHLEEGYANISLKAIRNILPYLKKGYSFSTAVLLGGIRNAFGQRFIYFLDFEPEIEDSVCKILGEKNKEGEAISKIKQYLISHNFGFTENDKTFNKLYHHSQNIITQKQEEKLPEIENLRNPIVQQGLNELRRTINKLLEHCREKYGQDFKFDHIHVELGRELRSSKKQREKQTRTILGNKHKNNEAREKLIEFGLKATRENIQKYLLYKEIEERAGIVCCPYTGRTISLSDALGSSNTIQIEHIIPKSISLDDSFANKTLCEAIFNREKAENTPHEFYQKNNSSSLWGVNSWEAVEERAFKLLPYEKAKRFTNKKHFENNDFIERQLNDTRYISKKAVEFLSSICKDVKVFPGQLTSELRHLWGLNNILQKINDIHLDLLPFPVEKRTDCYIVFDNEEKTSRIYKKQQEKPPRDPKEIILAGSVNKDVFYHHLLPEIPVKAQNGKYWTTISLSKPLRWLPLFAPKPVFGENHIIVKGLVEKGVFVCNSLKQKIKTELADGAYWINLPILKKVFIDGKNVNNLKLDSHQIQLFGTIKEGCFQCYHYTCSARGADGKFWCTLDTDIEHAEFTKIKHEAPEVKSDQIVLSGDIDEKGVFCADLDIDFQILTNQSQGKYYGIFNIESRKSNIIPIETAPPKPSKKESMVEGTIWIDKYTGEIKFDPKKNREDQRHHAIDAIVIALLSPSLLKYLSTYNARVENKKRGMDSTEKFPLPWPGFINDVRESINNILVSYRQNKKTLCKVNKTVIKNGQKLYSKGNAARGQLHKENVYGLRMTPGSTKGSYHIRKKIQELKTKAQLDKIVDRTIRQLLEEHLRKNYNIDTSKEYTIPANAFYRDGKYQIFLSNKNGEPVPIKKIRVEEKLGNAEPLKDNINQHVNPKNNHHVLIYMDMEGKLEEDVVTFWTAVERLNQQQPLFQRPQEDCEIITILQKNDMFLLGLSNDELEVYKDNRKVLSQHLYRVQKISSMDYNFNFHLSSISDDEERQIRIQSFIAWKKYNPIKVSIDEIGNITF